MVPLPVGAPERSARPGTGELWIAGEAMSVLGLAADGRANTTNAANCAEASVPSNAVSSVRLVTAGAPSGSADANPDRIPVRDPRTKARL